MHRFNVFTRRRFVHATALGAAALPAWAFAEELSKTAPGVEGPFYPDRMPLDTDNDLIVINDELTPAVGTVTHLGGRVLDQRGDPVPNARVEIWQTDSNGIYIHSRDRNRGKLDTNFQGFGRFLTGRKGAYYFRTIRPVSYPGRTPHIHAAVFLKGKRVLTTQLYDKGEQKRNDKDFLYKRLKTDQAKTSVTVDFSPVKDSKIGELSAHWDIVIG